MSTIPTVLTAAAVARLKPGDQRREVPDGGMRGLSLLIHPSGAKAWVMRYRRPGSMTAMAKLTLGTADVLGTENAEQPVIGSHLTLAAARALAGEMHRQRALGRDPAAERIAARAGSQTTEAGTFAAAARRYIAEYARPKTRRWEQTARMLGLRPDDLETVTTKGSIAYSWREGSKPIPDSIAHRWRNRQIPTITGDDIHAVLDETQRLGVPGLERRKGASELRRRTLAAVLSGCFKWMLKNRIVKVDPCAGMYRPAPSPPRERSLSDDELRWFWLACDAIGEPFGSLFRVLALTGQRREEVAG